MIMKHLIQLLHYRVTVSPTEDNSTNTSASTSYGGEVYVHGLMSGEVLDGSEEFHK
jgi:hypothetical protein